MDFTILINLNTFDLINYLILNNLEIITKAPILTLLEQYNTIASLSGVIKP
jgi:hypothetical protein